MKVDFSDFNFPADRDKKIDTIYVSPPWGGPGYEKLSEYTVDQLYPDFDLLVKKCLEFSGNLILFLPKNTSIVNLVDRLMPYLSQIQS